MGAAGDARAAPPPAHLATDAFRVDPAAARPDGPADRPLTAENVLFLPPPHPHKSVSLPARPGRLRRELTHPIFVLPPPAPLPAPLPDCAVAALSVRAKVSAVVTKCAACCRQNSQLTDRAYQIGSERAREQRTECTRTREQGTECTRKGASERSSVRAREREREKVCACVCVCVCVRACVADLLTHLLTD